MSENDLLQAVLSLAKVYGWKVAHFRPAMTTKGYRTAVGADGAGFPDLVLVAPIQPKSVFCRVLFVELKSGNGKMSEAQWSWNFRLRPNARVWKPADWHSGEILRTLSSPKEQT